jgi:putative ABC transport system permease protein
VKQALINAVLGYVAGLTITLLTMRLVESTGLAVVIPAELMVAIFFLTVLMCLAAAIISVRKALDVDPLVVFRT